MKTILYDMDKYQVELSDGRSIIGEDGKYTTTHAGYVVINKETGQIEHTTTMLPGAIFQCQHFDNTLTSLLMPDEELGEDIPGGDIADDVVIN